MGESATGRRRRHAAPTSSLRLVPSLSSLGEAVASRSRPSTCMHDPEPSLLGLWLGFLPLCRAPIVQQTLSSAISLFHGPTTALQSRPGVLEPQGPRTCHDECQAESFPSTSADQSDGRFSAYLQHPAMSP